jgi:hypothetical protein
MSWSFGLDSSSIWYLFVPVCIFSEHRTDALLSAGLHTLASARALAWCADRSRPGASVGLRLVLRLQDDQEPQLIMQQGQQGQDSSAGVPQQVNPLPLLPPPCSCQPAAASRVCM